MFFGWFFLVFCKMFVKFCETFRILFCVLYLCILYEFELLDVKELLLFCLFSWVNGCVFVIMVLFKWLEIILEVVEVIFFIFILVFLCKFLDSIFFMLMWWWFFWSIRFFIFSLKFCWWFLVFLFIWSEIFRVFCCCIMGLVFCNMGLDGCWWIVGFFCCRILSIVFCFVIIFCWNIEFFMDIGVFIKVFVGFKICWFRFFNDIDGEFMLFVCFIICDWIMFFLVFMFCGEFICIFMFMLRVFGGSWNIFDLFFVCCWVCCIWLFNFNVFVMWEICYNKINIKFI